MVMYWYVFAMMALSGDGTNVTAALRLTALSLTPLQLFSYFYHQPSLQSFEMA
jgi:hypothetical protein